MKQVTPEGWKPARGYAYAVEHDGRVHLAGVLGTVPETNEVVEGGFAAQWNQVWANMSSVLRAAGADPSTVVSIRIYVTSIDEYEAAGRDLREGWADVFGAHLPAITLLEVNRLVDPAAKIEAEAEAVVA